MRQAVILAVVGALLMAGALGRDLPDDVVREPLKAAGQGEASAFDSNHSNPVKEIWVTADNQILVELKEDEANRPNLFDLNGRTLVFTPDSAGGYSRQVRALEWEEEIGEEVQRLSQSRSVIRLESFDFPFAGQRWDSFYLGPPGVVTFGGPYTNSLRYPSRGVKGNSGELISGPTVSALYRPLRYGATHVAHRTDRIVVTWIAGDGSTWPHGVRPEKPARFQAILGADGSIRFNYFDVPFEDGIVGLFQEDEPTEQLPAGADLSRSESRASNLHHEVFHFRSNIELTINDVTCHLMRTLGDEFDLFVYHSQSRVDTLRATAWSGGDVARLDGCTQGRFKGSWYLPVWMKSRSVFEASPLLEDNEGFDSGLYLFAHEFGHHWLAYASYDKSGQRERLYLNDSCKCHWRFGLHTPAPFPWREDKIRRTEEVEPSSTMGGNFWVDHGNGSFTPHTLNTRGGFSWLDLYAMGLADAEEVPDMFLLRNLQPNNDPDKEGNYTGDKEIISIDQILLYGHPYLDVYPVLGPALSQKVFNAGFVYLLEPGQPPSGDMLALHARYKSRVPVHWAHITGGRSQITTVIPGTDNNRPPKAEGTIPAQTLTENGTVRRANLAGYFSDPDGDPLTYQAGSSDAEVVAARISGSTVTIQPGTAGTALVTVTATDGRRGLAYLAIEISVEALPAVNPSDFTFVPVILDAPGKGKAFFTSELTLAHRGRHRRAILDYTYTAHTGGGSGTVRDYLEPGQQVIIPNAIEFLRQRGAPIPGEGKRIGSLRVAFQRTDSSRVGVTVRTTTRVPEGRAGLAYPGLPAGGGFDEAVYLCGLRQNEQDRSNVAFQHMGTPRDGSITLRTTVFSGEPEISEGHRLEDRMLAPGGFYQFSELLKTAGFTNGYVRVERVEGEAPFYAYGVINDQANSDGSFVFPVTASSLEGKMRQTLPVIVETEEFTTELTLTNFSRRERTLDLAFVADGIRTPDETARFALTLAAGQQRIIADVIDAELRRRGVEGIRPSRGSLAGALFATPESGDLSGIVVGARTGSPDGRGGQYGVFYTAVPDGAAFTGDAWIYGLQQNEENRTNLALVNTGEVDDSRSTFGIEIYDENGTLQGIKFVHLEARRWRQINSILANHAPGITQGYVRIDQFIGNNPFLAYGVVNDGGAPGERSGDGAYLPARK